MLFRSDGASSPDVRSRNFVAEALSNHFAIERLNILISLQPRLGFCVKFCIVIRFDEFPLKKVKDKIWVFLRAFWPCRGARWAQIKLCPCLLLPIASFSTHKPCGALTSTARAIPRIRRLTALFRWLQIAVNIGFLSAQREKKKLCRCISTCRSARRSATTAPATKSSPRTTGVRPSTCVT